MKIKILLFSLFIFLKIAAEAQCVSVSNSSSIVLNSQTGTSPNRMCNYSFTPIVTVPNNGQTAKLLRFQFTAGTTTYYVCYTNEGSNNSPNVQVQVSTTECSGSSSASLPGGTDQTFPTANFSLPCDETTGNFSGFTAATGTGGACTGPTALSLNGSGPLPVKLSYFKVTNHPLGFELNWKTTEEVNSKEFVLQRSPDARIFKDITKVSSAGNSNEELSYSYIDNSPLNGNNYYRLKQIDIDGKIEYSKIEVANWMETESLYPNPVIDNEFQMGGINGEILKSSLFDISGKEIPIEVVTKPNNNIKVKINTKNLAGIYFFTIQTTEASISKRILIAQ